MSKALLNRLQTPHKFSPATIPPLTNKIIIVTGGNNGIGLETVLALSKKSPAKIYLACRSQAKFDTAMQTILKTSPDAKGNVEFLELDLNSLASVKKAAEQVLSECDRLDVLINNAGIMGAPPGLTSDGYEVHFGVNYIGHALLTKLLLPLILKTAKRNDVCKSDVRIINVSSAAGWNLVPKTKDGIDLAVEKTKMEDMHPFWRYGVSKLAQIVETRERARRYPEIMSVVVHPGRVQTTLLNGFMEKSKWNYMAVFQRAYDSVVGALTPEQGAWNQLWAGTANAGDMENGSLYVPVGAREMASKWCRDDALGKRLWEWTEVQFAEKGYA